MPSNQADDCPKIRAATAADLDAINKLIEKAVMTWNLPERVKRLSVGSYRYRPDELDYLTCLVAESEAGEITGVVTLEPADPKELPPGKTAGLLVHGIYVDPKWKRQGIGRCLLKAAVLEAKKRKADGLLVKAQPDANAFFDSQGFEKIAVQNRSRDYPHRWWKNVPTE